VLLFIKRFVELKFAVILIIYLFATEVQSKEKVKIATLEWEPFISSKLPNNGYTAEVIKAAFKNRGYDVVIEFVTLARGKKLLEQGLIDGYITPYGHIKETEEHLLSSPFHGDSIGLLKSKSLVVNSLETSSATFDDYIEQLARYKFGVIRGGLVSERFNFLPASNVHYSTNALQNIDNLAQGKVNFIVIGKYSAADIITNLRPHLIGKFEFLQTKESSNGFRIAFSNKSKKHLKIKKHFNKGLGEIELDGTLAELSKKHGIYPSKIADDKTILTVGTVNNRDMLILEELSSIFEKENPEIEIKWRIYDENTLRNRTLSDLAISDGQFDIVTIGLQEIPTWSKNEWLSPITNLPNDYEVSDIFQRLIDTHSYKNELYALPFYAESSVTYYRKDLFLKAGITMVAQPTYKDIIKYAEAIHNPTKGIYGICLRGKAGWGENMGLFTTMVNTYGGTWFDKHWLPKINSIPWKQALETYSFLITKFGPPQPTLKGYNENLQLFLAGKCGIWIDATIASNTLFDNELSLVSDHVGVVKAPTAVTSHGANWLWAWSFAIPANSQNKNIAQKFITWATSKSYINLVSQKKGIKSIPQGTRHSTYANHTYQASLPYADIMFEAMLDASEQGYKDSDKPYKGIQFVEISEFPAIGNYTGLLITEVIKGNITPEVALKKAQNHTKLQMDLSGYNKTGSSN
jgi:sorbitol/mannitol transport system substrate-binding protein